MNKHRKNVWTKFWQESRADSCAQYIQSHDSEIDIFWNDVSKQLSAKEVVVDLCTGQGAVIQALITNYEKTSNENTAPIFHGIDAATIINGQASDLLSKYPDNIRFYFSSPIENLPLADQSVNSMVSQFGFEYALSRELYVEINRVLLSGGSLYAVMHNVDSILTKNAIFEVEQISYLHNDLSIFNTVNELAKYFAMANNPANIQKLKNSEEANRLRSEFNQKITSLNVLIDNNTYNDIYINARSVVTEALKRAQLDSIRAAKTLLKDYIKELEYAKFRAEELIECALSKKEVNNLIKNLGEQLEISDYDIQVLKSKSEIVAWGLRIKKA